MRKLRLFVLFAAVAVVSAALAPQVFAQAGRPVHIVQTGCDTLSLDPPLVRVTFGVINLGPIPVCSIHLIPVQSGPTPSDSCRIISCSSAPGWQCSLDPAGGANWRIDPAAPPGCILQGQKHEPFDIELDPLYCCYIVEYDDGAGQIFFRDEVCFECQKPVPTKNTTWGSVKAQYR
jgi:hypothetical protein